MWFGITKEDHTSRDLLVASLPGTVETTGQHLEAMGENSYRTLPETRELDKVLSGGLPFYYGICPGRLAFLKMFKQTERFRLAYSPKEVIPMKISDMLARKVADVVTTGPRATLREALIAMAHNKVGALPVLDDTGRLAGIITERDLMRQVHQEITLEDVVVEDVMTEADSIKSGTLEDDIEYVMDAMTEGRFRHLPVVEDGNLVGIVSIGDVVKERLMEARREIGKLMDSHFRPDSVESISG